MDHILPDQLLNGGVRIVNKCDSAASASAAMLCSASQMIG